MCASTIVKSDNVGAIVERALDAGEGILRLTPTWVPRSFLQPGKRIKLAPTDWYALGTHRGGIDERWFSSTTEAMKLAKRFAAPPALAEQAAWLHDVSVVFPSAERLRVAQALGLAENFVGKDSMVVILGDNIFEEPVPGKSFSESAGVIDDKLESLSPETKEELKTVLKYLDNLLEELPEDKIKEFAKSEYYDLYVKILDKLGI